MAGKGAWAVYAWVLMPNHYHHWRKIAEAEVESTIAEPNRQQGSINKGKNAFKTLGGRLVKVTYCREDQGSLIQGLQTYRDSIFDPKIPNGLL